jgi:hypothetical protein
MTAERLACDRHQSPSTAPARSASHGARASPSRKPQAEAILYGPWVNTETPRRHASPFTDTVHAAPRRRRPLRRVDLSASGGLPHTEPICATAKSYTSVLRGPQQPRKETKNDYGEGQRLFYSAYVVDGKALDKAIVAIPTSPCRAVMTLRVNYVLS